MFKLQIKFDRKSKVNNIKIFACPTAEQFTQEICDNLQIEIGKIHYQKFSNNNFMQVLETVRGKDVCVVQTSKPPVNERVCEKYLCRLHTLDFIRSRN